MGPNLMNGRDVAKRIGLSYGRVITLAGQGRIPSFKTADGRRLFVVDEVVRARRVGAKPSDYREVNLP